MSSDGWPYLNNSIDITAAHQRHIIYTSWTLPTARVIDMFRFSWSSRCLSTGTGRAAGDSQRTWLVPIILPRPLHHAGSVTPALRLGHTTSRCSDGLTHVWLPWNNRNNLVWPLFSTRQWLVHSEWLVSHIWYSRRDYMGARAPTSLSLYQM